MDKWVELMVTSDDIEAMIIKDVLELEGIEAVIRSARISPYPVNIGPLGEVTILVQETDLDRAVEVTGTVNDVCEENNI